LAAQNMKADEKCCKAMVWRENRDQQVPDDLVYETKWEILDELFVPMRYSIIAAILCMLVTSAIAEPPVIAEIRLDTDPTKCLSGQQGKAAEVSSTHTRKFKFLPGLTDSSLVSLEAVGFTGYYVRYHKSVFFLHLRPKHLDPGFDSDATFKMVPIEGDKVRFESTAYPSCFMTARDDGAVVLLKNPPLDKSTFVLKKDSESNPKK
jgi:hypothetical protein